MASATRIVSSIFILSAVYIAGSDAGKHEISKTIYTAVRNLVEVKKDGNCGTMGHFKEREAAEV